MYELEEFETFWSVSYICQKAERLPKEGKDLTKVFAQNPGVSMVLLED